MKRPAFLTLGMLAIGLLSFLVLRGPARPDEDQVRAVIEEVAEAARAGDLEATLEPVSLSYHDEDGLDRKALAGFVFSQYRRRGGISVVLGPVLVSLDGEGGATASFEAGLADGADVSALELLPKDADLLHFDVQLRQEEGEWRIVDHHREPVFRER